MRRCPQKLLLKTLILLRISYHIPSNTCEVRTSNISIPNYILNISRCKNQFVCEAMRQSLEKDELQCGKIGNQNTNTNPFVWITYWRNTI